ncbi:DUF1932 domain-containing protein [Roseinatronobacter sp. S2]|uniref:DUF1932 domain-containing protein n=1 Tax=Roseinatronobacter sp. S2 TaxID=3035471 RepID=UPI0024102E4C|nr:DUF1932 domain-containing protein [Roseinatronobacter sp. S2]WFE76753.1 DUF1932 domain-containing protein [Roseinatronobacter sp. S2]
MTPTAPPDQVAFIGFGEATRAFVSGWGNVRPATMSAFDIKTQSAASRAAILAQYDAHGVCGTDSPAAALDGAALVFSLVSADQALVAAEAAAPCLPAGALWLDCNSCAPDTKAQAAEIIDAAGGRYVDVAIMAPVHPKRHLVPLLVSGPHAGRAMCALNALSMRPQIAGARVGQASSIKMLRSVMIKGMEALSAECFLAARRAGVEDQVLASLEGSDPDINWRARASYNLERMAVHGARRASEMHEVAATVAALGLPCAMSAASAQWQARIADLQMDPGDDDLIARMDRILAVI